jgi:hypothetical protein
MDERNAMFGKVANGSVFFVDVDVLRKLGRHDGGTAKQATWGERTARQNEPPQRGG